MARSRSSLLAPLAALSLAAATGLDRPFPPMPGDPPTAARVELGRLLFFVGVAACDPQIMGWGPVPAVKKALKSAGVRGDAIDHVEVNGAFAPQALACIRDFAKMGIALVLEAL